jgi:hypothetical protein
MLITGITFLDDSIAGRLRVKDESINVDFGGQMAETLMANGRPHFAMKGVASKIECTVLHASDIKIADFKAGVERSLVIQTDTGKAYVLSPCVVAETLKLTGGQGDFPLVFVGGEIEEVA